MSTLNHTPGPWWPDEFSPGCVAIMGPNDDLVAMLDFPIPGNAALIAAAPDLLAALRQIAAHKVGGEPSLAASVARAALVKAGAA